MIKFKSVLKKFTAVALSAFVAATSFPGGFKAKAEEAAYEGTFDSYIYFVGSSEGSDDYDFMYNAPGDANNAGNITMNEAKGVKVGDTFTVSMEFDKPVSEILSLEPVLKSEPLLSLSVKVSLKIDDQEVALSKAGGKSSWWFEDKLRTTTKLYGGYEQFEESQQYFKDAENIPTGFKKIEYTIEIKDATKSDVIFDPAGKYNGYLCFQTPAYSFRNDWAGDNGKYGLGYTDETGMDYFHQVTGWTPGDNSVAEKRDGEFIDTEIAGNGTYEVKVTGLNFDESEFADQAYFNIIMLSTDLPKVGGAEISDVKLNVDGNDIECAPVVNDEVVEYLQVQIQSKWNPAIAEIGYYAVPPKEMTITFTVSGFNYDKAGSSESSSAESSSAESSSAESSSAEPAESSSAAPAESSSAAPADSSSTKSDSASSSADSASLSSSSASDSSSSSSGGLGTPALVGILAGAIAVVGGIVFAVTKKKK